MSLKLNSERIIYYDFIRAFAIFGVVACHCFAPLVTNVNIFGTKLWYYALFLNSLRDISVPLFVLVSGALLITKKDSVTFFIKKRLKKVIVPYIFWIVIFLIFMISYFHYENPILFILKTLSIPPIGKGIAFWFVQMIILIYIIIIILNKLQEHNKVFLKIGLIISIIFLFLLNFNIIPTYPMPFNYIYFSAYAIFGYYLSSYDFSNNKILKSFNITNEKLCIIFFALSVILYLFEIYFNASNSLLLNKHSAVSQFGFLNVFLVISIFLFFRYFTQSKGKFNKICNYITKNKIGEFIFSVSFCSYGIYLCHLIILNFMRNSLSFMEDITSTSFYYSLLLILTLIIPWLIILAMDKVPVLKYFSGK